MKDLKNNFSCDIKIFREIASRVSLSLPTLFKEFCDALADIFKLSRTFMLVVSYDLQNNDYIVMFENGFAEKREELDRHKKFAVGIMELIPDDWPLYLFNKHEMPKCADALLQPEALGLVRFDTLNREKTSLLFYTFEESENMIFSKCSEKFLLSAASYVMIALQKNIYETRMNELLYNDSLTEIPNRMYFYHMLVGAIQLADYTNSSFAVLIVNLSNIKAINDTYGYHIGDHVIKIVSRRLQNVVDDEYMLSRFNGNDFSLYIPNVDKIDMVYSVCERIIEELKDPIDLDFTLIQTAISIGISMFPDDGESVDMILKNAEAAMFQASKDTNVPYKLYSPSITIESYKQLSLSTELNQAVTNDEFEMFYQAQLDIKCKRIKSVEALIRWHHPKRGLLPPYEFIPFAETNGHALDIDRLVLRKVCEQAKKWYDLGKKLTIGVNISAEHFRNGVIVESLSKALEETNAPPHMIDIELLEGVLIEDLESTISILRNIRSFGVSVSLDDFGTGYSSLEYITMLPLDFLKIDRGFVMNMDKNPRNKIIIKTIIMLAKEIGFRVVAEGVETQDQLNFLKQYDCDHAQGYLIGKPAPLNELEGLLTKYI